MSSESVSALVSWMIDHPLLTTTHVSGETNSHITDSEEESIDDVPAVEDQSILE